MDDQRIVALLHARSEQALAELDAKYGTLCRTLAQNLLTDPLDAEECVNDAYLAVWNTVPPQTPAPLLTYLARIVRNIAAAKYRANTARKRNSFYDAALDELADSLASPETADEALDAKELAAALEAFLDTLDRENRCLFVRRYWYADAIPTLAQRFHMSENRVSVRLSRTRQKLKSYLKKEGYDL